MKNVKLIIKIMLLIIVAILMTLVFIHNKKLPKKDNNNVNIYGNDNKPVGQPNNRQEPPKENSNIHKKVIKSKIPIFMYHNVSDNTGKDKYINNYLPPSKLDEQLKYIHDNNYQTIFVNQLSDLEDYKKPVALTFDDGYENFFENAYPLFKKYNEKATINVITQYINQPNYLSSDQITQMIQSGLISIESHTKSHVDLAKVSNESLENELKNSQADLKNLFGIDNTVICYPSGSYNQNVIQKASEYYKYGLTTKNSVYDSQVNNLLEIPRVRVSRDIKMDIYISYLSKSEVIEQ